MKVTQQADTLTLFGAVESLQRIVQNAPNHEALRQQAEAEGFDPDFVDEVMKRVRTESNKNFLQRRVTTKEISAAVLGLLNDADGESDVRGSRAMIWHQAREAVKKSGEKLGRLFGELDTAILDELEGLYLPRALNRLGEAKLAMWRPVLEARLSTSDHLQQLSEELTTMLKQTAGLDQKQLEARLLQAAGKEAESAPWKMALAMAFSKTEKGKRGEDPTAEDLAEMFLDLGLLEELMGELDACEATSWVWPLQTQAQAVQTNRNVFDAFHMLADAVGAY